MAATAAGRERIEIVGERRRSHDAAFRAQVVTDSLAAGARVRDVARRHGICTSLVYRWRRAAGVTQESTPTLRLVPVRITEDVAPLSPASTSAPRRPGLIEIELAGGVCVRVEETVSLTALRRVLSALRR